MTTEQPVNGLVILVLRIRHPDVREQIIHRLCNIGEQITNTVYELQIGDWDDGLWEDEVNWLSMELEGTEDQVVVWKCSNQGYTRFSITASTYQSPWEFSGQ